MGKMKRKLTKSRTAKLTIDVGNNNGPRRPSMKKKIIKMRHKHDTFMHKIETLKNSTKTAVPSKIFKKNRRLKMKLKTRLKTKMNREKETPDRDVIIGSMKSLLDALPVLKDSTESKSTKLQRNCTANKKQSIGNQKKKALRNFKASQRNMMKDIAVFRQVLKHPVYMEDPASAISIHLRNKMEMDSNLQD